MPALAISPLQFVPETKVREARTNFFQESVNRIAAIWLAIVDCIVYYFQGILEAFSWYSAGQKLVMDQFAAKASAAENLAEKMYFMELRSQVGSLPKGNDPLALIKTIDGTGDRLEALAARVEEKIDGLVGDKEAADAFYRESMEELARLQHLPCTQVQRALYAGRLTDSFRRLDDLFSGDGPKLHRYCGCHVQPEDPSGGIKNLAPGLSGQNGKFDVPHPEQEDPNGMPKNSSAVLLSWSLGGGHNVVQHAMSQRLAEKGGHVYKVEADEEVLEGYYNLRKWTGYSGVEWGDYFLQNGYWGIIRFLGWISSGRDSVHSREDKVRRFALSLLARGDQDAAVMCFTRHTSAAEKAASRLGMACYDVATDLDYDVFDFEKDAENPHFRHALMAADPKRQAELLDRMLEPHQIVEGGFPVREAFLRNYTEEEIRNLRQKYADRYGLSPDARVVILLCGGAGVPNTFAETLAGEYSNQPGAPKVHLFAICGKNEEKKKELEARFNRANPPPRFKASALGWTNEETLGELFAMGALDRERQGYLISAKAGGGTISEAIARGIPTLVYDANGVLHEKKNVSFLTAKGLGKSFDDERHLPALLAEGLQTPFEPERSPNGEAYSQFDSKRKSMEQLSELVREARQDEGFQRRKPSGVRLPPMAGFLDGED